MSDFDVQRTPDSSLPSTRGITGTGLRYLEAIAEFHSLSDTLISILNAKPISVLDFESFRENAFHEIIEYNPAVILCASKQELQRLSRAVDEVFRLSKNTHPFTNSIESRMLEYRCEFFKQVLTFVRNQKKPLKQQANDTGNASTHANEFRDQLKAFQEMFILYRRNLLTFQPIEENIIHYTVASALFKEIHQSKKLGERKDNSISALLQQYVKRRINDKSDSVKVLSHLVELYLISVHLPNVLQDEWCKANLPETLSAIHQETEQYLRRATVSTVNAPHWELALLERLKGYFQIIRRSSRYSEEVTSVFDSDILYEKNLRSFYKSKFSPDMLRDNWQELAGLFYQTQLYVSSLQNDEPKKVCAAIEKVLELSIEKWFKSPFSRALYISNYLSITLSNLRSSIENHQSTEEIQISLSEYFPKIQEYLTLVFDVIYTWVLIDNDHGSYYPITVSYSGEEAIFHRDSYFSGDQKHTSRKRRNSDLNNERAFVIEVSPERVPCHKDIPALFEEIQKQRLVDPSKPGFQNALQSHVTAEEITESLAHHAGTLFGVISDQGEFSCGALFETVEEIFSEEGRRANERSKEIPALNGSKKSFLKIFSALVDARFKFNGADKPVSAFKMIHTAIQSRAIAKGDPLENQAILAWVREGEFPNEAIFAYEKAGWVKTSITEDFPEQDPRTGRDIKVPYRLIYYMARKIDPIIAHIIAEQKTIQ